MWQIEYASMLLVLLKLLKTQVWTLCLCPFLRYHNCAHYDHTDGERPLLPAASICHQGVRRLLLDLLCVCVCSTHWVCFCSLQCWLPAQRKGQSEGQQAQLWGEKNIPIMHSQSAGNIVELWDVLWIMSTPFKHRCGLGVEMPVLTSSLPWWPSASQLISIVC